MGEAKLPDSHEMNERVDGQLRDALSKEVEGVEHLLGDHDASIPPLSSLEGDLYGIDTVADSPDDPDLGS